MNNVVISNDVIYFLRHQKKLQHPNIVIYRDVCNISYGYGREFTFIPKLKVLDNKRPNEYFIMYDNSYGIPLWIENGLLAQLENKPILITLKKNGLFKGLKLETGYEIITTQ